GYAKDAIDSHTIFPLYIGLDFMQSATSMLIMSTTGAIMEVAISIPPAVHEIHNQNPTRSRKNLFASGVAIGRDILGTDTNTLFFAFFGGYLGLLLWFKDLSYSFGEIINSKIFSGEITMILCAGIGIALIIPIASWISTYFMMKSTQKDETA